MNERIREFALLAGRPGYPRGESELQKFAELIVLQCADVAVNHHLYGPPETSADTAIKTHFGVE